MRTSAWIEVDRFSKKLGQTILAFDKAGYKDDQPRVPKGSASGGQWTSGGGGGPRSTRVTSRRATAGGSPRSKVKREAAKWTTAMSARAKDVRKEVDTITNPRSTDAEKQQASDRIAQHTANNWRDIQKVPDKVWYKEGFADEVWKTLADPFSALFGVAFAPVLYGGLIAVTGAYLMGRWIYRKIATGGRYAGVKSSLDTYFDDMKNWREGKPLDTVRR